jgi:hypothetical protein
MRTFLLVLTGVLLLSSSQAFAQTKTTETKTIKDSATGVVRTETSTSVSTSEDITPRNNMLLVNPLKFFLFYNLTYYRRLNESVAFGVGASIPGFLGQNFGGIGANAELRFYPGSKALHGFYIAPNFYYNTLSVSASSGSDEASVTLSTAGILAGWQWFPSDDFALGFALGVDYYIVSAKDNGNPVDVSNVFPRTFPALRFDLGYTWK